MKQISAYVGDLLPPDFKNRGISTGGIYLKTLYDTFPKTARCNSTLPDNKRQQCLLCKYGIIKFIEIVLILGFYPRH